ncbi:MAG: phosphoribosylformylglycinamidine synthase, partial [Bacteroidota bacterium]
MVFFFGDNSQKVIAVGAINSLSQTDIAKLQWLFNDANLLNLNSVKGYFAGPRREMITPWSTNAVEIAMNMGIQNIQRIEEFFAVAHDHVEFDPMLQQLYNSLDQDIFTIHHQPEDILYIDDIK